MAGWGVGADEGAAGADGGGAAAAAVGVGMERGDLAEE